MGNQIDPAVGDKPAARFVVGAGGGLIALVAPLTATVGIDNIALSVLAGAFGNAAGAYLMMAAVDRGVKLTDAFSHNVRGKLGACTIVAAVVGTTVAGVNIFMKPGEVHQPAVPTVSTPKI